MLTVGYALLAFAVALTAYSVVGPIHGLLVRNVFRQREHVTRELREMFIMIPVERLQAIKWSIAAFLSLLGFVLSFEAPMPGPVVAGALLAVVGYWSPEVVITVLRRRRRTAFSNQLVDALVLMANGLRSGFTLTQALEMLVDEMPAPMSQEFRLVQEELRLGVGVDQALQNCVTRTNDKDLDLVVTAIKITRQLGGNLPEVFERIVAMVRDRKLVDGKAHALTASGRMQATVVGILPYVFALLIAKIHPDLMELMWTTVPGFMALVAAIILDVVGYFWVLRLSRIKY